MKNIFLLTLSFISSSFVFAQKERTKPVFQHDLFVPGFHMPAGNQFRSAKGIPGPSYWQNSASYIINATLNEKDTSITGKVSITYTNNSPDQLDYLWLQLDQNIFESSSRAAVTTTYPGDYFGVKGQKNGGYKITDVSIIQNGKITKVKPVITDTRMQIRLNTPMRAKGDTITIKMDYHFLIPEDGAGRFGRQHKKRGVIYQIAQWYPRMCVYDDVEGWNALPYLGQGEFYCDFGDFEYYITAPSDMIIYGSGDLQNSKEVLTSKEFQQLEKASNSDQTVIISGADDPVKRSVKANSQGNLTWHFRMKNSRDVAFVAGKGMIWDAARVDLPSGRKALAMSCYPVESMGDTAWSRSTEYLKACIEIYSKHFYEYPWNHAVSSAGITSGMEYPGLIFNNSNLTGSRLWFLIAHEIGHNWYPLVVGSNERKYMWLDEGLNTFINHIATDLFNNGEYANDPAYQTPTFFASRNYEQFMDYNDPLMIVTDAMTPGQRFQYYSKTAYGLNLLRTVIVGKERFDYAFRKYTEAWAYKHPGPYDFFHSINNGTGEDLSWFWKQWFFTTWKFDQAIKTVEYIDKDPAKGVLITIDNKEKLIFPIIAQVIQTNGQEETIKIPVEVWQRGNTWTFHYPSKHKISKIILDPDRLLPDRDRANNEWSGK